MKLASVHFEVMIPIPGGDTVERHFYAHEGWAIDRLEDGGVFLSSPNAGSFIADGFAYTFTLTASDLAAKLKTVRARSRGASNGGT